MKTPSLNELSPIEPDTRLLLHEILVDNLKFDKEIISKYKVVTEFQRPSKKVLITATNLLPFYALEPKYEEIMRSKITQVLEYLSENINASMLDIKIECLKESREFLFI